MKRTGTRRHYVDNVGRTRRKRIEFDDVLVIPDEYPSAASTGWISEGTAGAVGDRRSIGWIPGGEHSKDFLEPLLHTAIEAAPCRYGETTRGDISLRLGHEKVCRP